MSEPYPDQPTDQTEERDVESDHMVETTETLRDGDPETMPMDRGSEAGDRPLGAEKFGTTHAEEVEGESLDDRIGQERPDTGEHDPVEDIVAADPQTFATDDADAEQTDEAVLDDAYGDATSPAHAEADDTVGRLVEPDQGAGTDTEKDVVARDGGGTDLSAEEAALHVEEPR